MILSEASKANTATITNAHYPIYSGLRSAAKGEAIVHILANILDIPNAVPTILGGNR